MKQFFLLVVPVVLLVASPGATAADWAPGQPVGSTFPDIDLVDQHGERWTTGELPGRNGYVFFFLRSSDW